MIVSHVHAGVVASSCIIHIPVPCSYMVGGVIDLAYCAWSVWKALVSYILCTIVFKVVGLPTVHVVIDLCRSVWKEASKVRVMKGWPLLLMLFS